MIHKPVLLNEILETLNPQPGQLFIDGTANGGGHTFAVFEKKKKTDLQKTIFQGFFPCIN